MSTESARLMTVAMLMGIRGAYRFTLDAAAGPPVARRHKVSIYRLAEAARGGDPHPPTWVSFYSGSLGVGWIRQPTIQQALGAVILLDMIDTAERSQRLPRPPGSAA
jgi:hypothetical protein